MKPFYKTFLLLFLNSTFLIFNSFSQNPLVKQWDYRFGGNQEEWFTDFQQTKDGGYILGGTSLSGISGDKTQLNHGGGDYWIVKTDSMGIKQWDKDFGGGGGEEFHSLQQTTDGGYILAGSSISGISGDKSTASYGLYDYWIIKIDSLGIKQWDSDFGGDDHEELLAVKQTADGGYILGGYSYSGISGNKTQGNWDPTFDTPDYWVVKTDSLGNKQWDKVFGGNDDDFLFSTDQTADGGYIVGGESFSGVSGNKSQTNKGVFDYWIVKMDSLGNKQWDKDLGGTSSDQLTSIKQTADGGFIMGGYSDSQMGGDKSQNCCNPVSDIDYWIIKTDSSGIKLWDKDLGGSEGDYGPGFGNIFFTKDGGYLYCGSSQSNSSCDKTEDNLAFINPGW